MKKIFCITTLFLIHTIESMTFDQFEQMLGDLHKKNAIIDRRIHNEHDEANALLQVSSIHNSPFAITHLAHALKEIHAQYPWSKTITFNKRKWPVLIMRLSVADKEKLNQDYAQILDIMNRNHGFPIRLADLVSSLQKICLSLAFPKEVNLSELVSQLKQGLAAQTEMQLYPTNTDKPVEHIVLQKFEDAYCLRYVKRDNDFLYERILSVFYDYRRSPASIKYTKIESGDFNSLPRFIQDQFINLP